ncbi:MAG TPA: glycosyltransferase family 4 protein [Deltaproteobacteria bacterium]|nr:glycosyltransferase family 4 protein [Deltaproteobacteria bacterium]
MLECIKDEMIVASLFVSSVLLGGIGAFVVMKFGPVLDLVDVPNNRSSHDTPTPKGGGIGILAVFMLTALVEDIPIGFWVPVTFLALVSLFGDMRNLSVLLRLVVQFTAAVVVLVSIIVAGQSTLISTLRIISVIAVAGLFLIYIAGSANIYNFMDGINGIAAVTGVVAFSLLAWYASLIEFGSSYMVLCLCMACACLGFLPFNMPRAKVFMGDVGSILLGFVFALMTIVLADNFTVFCALASCLFFFYADELTTMYLRVRDGERLSKPHRRHLYQLLVNEMGIQHWKVSLGYGVCQLCIGYSSLVVTPHGPLVVFGLLGLYFLGFAAISHRVRGYVIKRNL